MADRPDSTRMPDADAGRPASPFRLNLEQQRKRAKDLLKGLRAGEAEALRRFRARHPGVATDGAMPGDLARLSEAQLVIARELGLPSWPKLKAHVEAMDETWTRIISGDAAPDRGMTTLHIRCGSDIAPSLRQAGFAGDFLEYSDPLCQGPVTDAPDWLDRRADFLAERYGEDVQRDRARIAADLAAAEQGLRAAAQRYERVVLWFEHDSYDQLILARCLAQFAEARPARLDLVSAGAYPGAMRFIGLGQLPPEALRLLWNARAPVPEAALRAGRDAWAALRAPDPRALAAMAAGGVPAPPALAAALRRHCQELPWTRDGLSLTERLVLELLAERPQSVGEAYKAVMLEREPLPWMTDLMIRRLVDDMRSAPAPVFTGGFEGEDRHWPQERLTITPLGRAVLAGEVDWLSLQPPERWLGGVRIAGALCWRWDDAAESIVQR